MPALGGVGEIVVGRLLLACGSIRKEITGLVYERRAGYMFHPVVDFLLAGGGSVVILVPAYFLIPDTHAARPVMLALGLALLNVINYPHFAHSYQLLYAGIGNKIFGRDAANPVVRLRYIWAAIIAPVALACSLALAYLSGDAVLLGLGVNVMALLVGWHYVKQGYGVLIVLSAARRIFYTAGEKKALLANSYAVWFYSWLAMNSSAAEDRLLGIKYFSINVPSVLHICGTGVALLTSLYLAVVLIRRVVVNGQPLSLNGLVGYGCPMYFWVLAWQADPVFNIFVPAFHSLQYLLIVWRYQLTKVRFESVGWRRHRNLAWLRFGRFLAAGIALGWLGFVAVPAQLDSVVHYSREVWGPVLFAYMFLIFINVHHYFIDNVIWRKENDEVRRYLFDGGRAVRLPIGGPGGQTVNPNLATQS